MKPTETNNNIFYCYDNIFFLYACRRLDPTHRKTEEKGKIAYIKGKCSEFVSWVSSVNDHLMCYEMYIFGIQTETFGSFKVNGFFYDIIIILFHSVLKIYNNKLQYSIVF